MKHSLSIISVSKKQTLPQKKPQELLQEQLENLWAHQPDTMLSGTTAEDRERLSRTLDLLPPSDPPIKVADIGCGSGEIAHHLANDHEVILCDLSKRALNKASSLIGDKAQYLQTGLPETSLTNVYDLVLCLDVLAFLPPNEMRLAISELSRILHKEGTLLFSTPVDIHSSDAIERLLYLLQTEFEILDYRESYHALLQRLCHLLANPSLYSLSYKQEHTAKKELSQRKGLSRWWFKLQLYPGIAHFWGLLSFTLRPIIGLFKQNRILLLILEKITRWSSQRNGISHMILLLKRKSLFSDQLGLGTKTASKWDKKAGDDSKQGSNVLKAAPFLA